MIDLSIAPSVEWRCHTKCVKLFCDWALSSADVVITVLSSTQISWIVFWFFDLEFIHILLKRRVHFKQFLMVLLFITLLMVFDEQFLKVPFRLQFL